MFEIKMLAKNTVMKFQINYNVIFPAVRPSVEIKPHTHPHGINTVTCDLCTQNCVRHTFIHFPT